MHRFAFGWAGGLSGMGSEGVGLVHGVGLNLAEADEGVHLVEVAADLGFEADELGDVVSVSILRRSRSVWRR